MQIKPLSPQSIGQVLDSSFKLFRLSWRRVWLLAFGAGIAGLAGDTYNLLVDADHRSMGVAIFITLAGLLVSLVFYAAIYLRQGAMADGGSPGGELSEALRRSPAVVLMTLAFALAVGGAALPPGLFAAFGVQQGWHLGVLIAGTAVLCILPILLLVKLTPSTAVLLLEKRRPLESLRRSARLVRGHWWRTAVILSVGGVILLVGYFVIGVVVGALAPLLSGLESTVTVVFAIVLGVVLIGMVATPYFIAMILVLYYDLKLRTEGGDLAARIEGLD